MLPSRHHHTYTEYGPRNDLAQTWTPHWLVEELWAGMVKVGFDPKTDWLVTDLAAGIGRLVDPIRDECQLLLNDIDSELCSILEEDFPTDWVCNLDFTLVAEGREQLPPSSTIVGSPPWIEGFAGYLPQVYVEAAEKMLVEHGLLGLVIPKAFEPETMLDLAYEYVPDEARLRAEKYDFVSDPAIRIYLAS